MTALPETQSRGRKPAKHATGTHRPALLAVTGLAPGALIARAARLICTCALISLAPLAIADTPVLSISPAAEQRIEALIAEMTLAEKVGQLSLQWGGETQDINPVVTETKRDELLGLIRAGKIGALLGAHGAEYTNRLQRVAVEESRHGIPLLFGNDVIHGYRTTFPIPLGGAATWDTALIEKSERVAAIEAAAAGTHWTFAPMVDIARDPRWGRVAEGAGEDPVLGAAMAAARVRGFQGDDLSAKDTVLACAKHYVAYGGAEGGRDYNTVDISLQTLHEVHLPPFKAAVDAGVATLMSAFNEINGVPASANRYTLTTVLRERWGFPGFVVSDWTSITEVTSHGFATGATDAAIKAIVAGVDMDLSSMSYREKLVDAVSAGRVAEAIIDQAVRRVLRVKFATGLFDDPYLDPEIEKRVMLCAEHRALAREVARNAIVLLRNEGGLLPIKDTVKSIAVIGPLADSRRDPLGTWNARGRPEDVITVIDGLRERAGESVVIRQAKGCDVRGGGATGFADAVTAASESDLVVMVLGESEDMSGEAHSRSAIELPGHQQDLLKVVSSVGKPVVVVLMNGRPMALPWMAEHVPAIVVTWHLGTECGHAVADVLFGDFNPCGKLPMTFPRATGQIPIYHAHKNTGRPPTDDRYTSKYIDLPSTPLYPFGHGLSYTSFAYRDLSISPHDLTPDGTLTVAVEIVNTGRRAGSEVAQLYVRDLVGSTTRPVKQLKAFTKVLLAAGESKTVRFTLPARALGFYDWDMRYVVEPGEFKLWVGGSSTGGLEGDFRITK